MSEPELLGKPGHDYRLMKPYRDPENLEFYDNLERLFMQHSVLRSKYNNVVNDIVYTYGYPGVVDKYDRTRCWHKNCCWFNPLVVIL